MAEVKIKALTSISGNFGKENKSLLLKSLGVNNIYTVDSDIFDIERLEKEGFIEIVKNKKIAKSVESKEVKPKAPVRTKGKGKAKASE